MDFDGANLFKAQTFSMYYHMGLIGCIISTMINSSIAEHERGGKGEAVQIVGSLKSNVAIKTQVFVNGKIKTKPSSRFTVNPLF